MSHSARPDQVAAAFVAAVDRGDIGEVRAMLRKGCSPDTRSPRGLPALTTALRAGRVDVAQALLNAGAEPVAQPWLWNSRRLATRCNDRALVRRLLASGMDPAVPGPFGRTLIHVAADRGATAVLLVLIEAGLATGTPSRTGTTPLHEAAGAGHLDTTRALLSAGAQVDPVDEDGFTPLTWADMNGHEEIVDVLLLSGAEEAPRVRHGRTVLHRAVLSRRVSAVRRALGEAADVCARDHWAQTPLHLAARVDRPAIIRALLSAGAEVDAQDWAGYTPLMEAAHDQGGRHPATVRLLLDAGPNLQLADGSGATSLHHLVFMGDPAAIRDAVSHGAALEARNDNDETPWLVAATYADTSALKVLATAGANVHATNSEQENALHLCLVWDMGAVRQVHRAVRALLGYGVDPCAQDARGRTPVTLAEDKSRRSLAQELRNGCA